MDGLLDPGTSELTVYCKVYGWITGPRTGGLTAQTENFHTRRMDPWTGMAQADLD